MLAAEWGAKESSDWQVWTERGEKGHNETMTAKRTCWTRRGKKRRWWREENGDEVKWGRGLVDDVVFVFSLLGAPLGNSWERGRGECCRFPIPVPRSFWILTFEPSTFENPVTERSSQQLPCDGEPHGIRQAAFIYRNQGVCLDPLLSGNRIISPRQRLFPINNVTSSRTAFFILLCRYL